MPEFTDRWERAKRRVISIQLSSFGVGKHTLIEPDSTFHRSETKVEEIISEVIEIHEIKKFPRVKYCYIGLYYSYSVSPFQETKRVSVEEVVLQNPTEQDLLQHAKELEKMATRLLDLLAESLLILR